MAEINAGYTIKEQVSLMNSTYVLGHNPNAPAPFVTWSKDNNGGYSFGHYFSNENDARLDLLSRAMNHMPEEQIDKLALSMLSEEAISNLQQKDRDERAMEDIDLCLDDALEHLNIDAEDKVPLMKNPEFRSEALRVFWNQDHSYENEALTQSLEQLIQDKFPQYLSKPSLDAVIQSAQQRKNMTAGDDGLSAPQRGDSEPSL